MEWREEMLGVFDQARRDARERGWLAYGRFGCREIAGLLRLEAGGRWRWALGGALVGLSAAGLFAPPEMYTSEAKIRTLRSSIPERFVPAYPSLTARDLQTSVFPVILSRRTIINLIQLYDLFKSERAYMPMEDCVELFQRRVEVGQLDAQTIRVAFSYGDPRMAQRVARDLMTRLIDETIRERYSMSMTTVNFLTSQADRAATAWEALSARARAAGPNSERLLLDRDLARSHYETLRRQVIEAEMIAGMEERKQGPSVEVFDLPSLPERPEISHAAVLAAGAFGGFTLGLLLGWLRRLRSNANLQPAALH
jgi:uncharacterized protein involved in exopolysaccharide biosynthesis